MLLFRSTMTLYFKYITFSSFQHFASGHYEKALLAICAGDADDY